MNTFFTNVFKNVQIPSSSGKIKMNLEKTWFVKQFKN